MTPVAAEGTAGESRPRLLYVVTLAEVGGAQSYVIELLPAAAQEFDVVVAAYGEGPLRDACAALGIAFVPLRNVRRPLSPRDLLGLVELIHVFRTVRPQLVHLNSSKAGWLGRVAARLTGVPVVVFTAHGWAFRAKNKKGRHFYRIADRIVAPLTTMTICVSESEREAGIAAHTCSAERSTAIVNAVDTERFSAPVHRPRRDVADVVSVGRLAKQKNFPALVRAARFLQQGRSQIRLIGDGPQRGELTELIAELGVQDRVILEGEVSDVPRYLAEADVFVLSTYSEGMPIAMLEAMAAGLPVVASRVNGVVEAAVDGETALLVTPDDPAALATAIERLVDDPGLRESLGRAGRRRVEELFSLPAWREAHLRVYRYLLGGAPARERTAG